MSIKRPADHKGIMFLYGLFLFLSILPFWLLAFYNFPLGTHAWQWITNWHNYASHLNFWQEQWFWYHESGGRFTTMALLATTDAWFTLARFPWVFVVFQLGVILALAVSVKAAFVTINWSVALGIGASLFTFYLVQLTGVYDSLYFYSSVLIYYSGMIGIFLFFGGLSRYWNDLQQKRRYPVAFVLAMIGLSLMGTNEPILFLCIFSLGLIAAYRWSAGQSLSPTLKLIIVGVFIGACCAILAPGNFARMGAEAAGAPTNDLLRITGLTLGATIFIWTDWLLDSPYLFVLFCWMIFSSWYGVKLRHQLPLPYLLAALVFWLPIGLGIVLLGTNGHGLPERVVDMLFLLVLVLSILVLQGAIESFPTLFTFVRQIPRQLLVIGVFLGLGSCLLSGLSIDRSENENTPKPMLARVNVTSNIGQAWKILLDGTATDYKKNTLASYGQLATCKNQMCELSLPEQFPPFIYLKINDPRHSQKGDIYMGVFFNPIIERVRFRQDTLPSSGF